MLTVEGLRETTNVLVVAQNAEGAGYVMSSFLNEDIASYMLLIVPKGTFLLFLCFE